MKTYYLLPAALCLLFFSTDGAEATIITTEIYIEQVVHNDMGINLQAGDTVGFFSFDTETPFIDRDASDYGGSPEGIPTDTWVNYNSVTNQYSGSFEIYWDRDYYDFSFTEEKLPFQFNVEQHTYTQGFNIESISFDTSSGYLGIEVSRGLYGDGRQGEMGSNQVVMGSDWESYVFRYGIRSLAPSQPTPVPEPGTILLFGTGLCILATRKRSLMRTA